MNFTNLIFNNSATGILVIGHIRIRYGDDVLKHLSSFVLSEIRKEDIFAIWGGEEFMILMPNTTLHMATKKAESLREAIANFEAEGIPQFFVSFGVTSYRTNEIWESLLKRVDSALYQSKNAGRNRTITLI